MIMLMSMAIILVVECLLLRVAAADHCPSIRRRSSDMSCPAQFLRDRLRLGKGTVVDPVCRVLNASFNCKKTMLDATLAALEND